MKVSAIGVNNYANKTAFNGEPNSKGKKTGGAGKAWCSVAIPGLGQFLDGRNKEGAWYLGGSLGLGAATAATAIAFIKAAEKNVSRISLENPELILRDKSVRKAGVAGAVGLSVLYLANIGLRIANIVDAYKGNRAPKSTEA